MKELALHILDIAENSIKAEADKLTIKIIEDTEENIFKIIIKDNGKGIENEILENITDPFITTNRKRPVGLGLSLFKAAAQRCSGHFKVDSNKDGTIVKADFTHNHIDRAPLGDIAESIISIIIWNPEINLTYRHQYNEKSFVFNTKEIKTKLKEVSICEAKILNWLKNYIKENVKEIRGGESN